MEVFSIRLPEEPTQKKPVIIVPISDTHFGSVAHDSTTWNKVKKFIKDTPNCYWICLGDMGEFIPPKDKRFDASMIAEHMRDRMGDIITATIEEIVKEFSPIKDKLLLMTTGNHDDKYRKAIGVDIVKLVAEQLGVKQKTFPYEALVKVFFGKKSRYSTTMYVSHGFGGGLLKGAKMNRISHMARNFEADIYIAGHSHDLMAAPDKVITTNSTGTAIIEKTRWLIRVAGFRKSRSFISDYEEKTGMPPNVTGTVAIEFYRAPEGLNVTVKFLT